MQVQRVLVYIHQVNSMVLEYFNYTSMYIYKNMYIFSK